MKLSCPILSLFAVLLLLIVGQPLQAQPGFKPDIKKEKPYEERVLKAEKTGEGKLKAPKRIMQNLTTRFNYYFNANNKFNDIWGRAKAAHKDDFTQLLPFYNYSLDATAADSAELDSVIYKARTGIVVHDLRNEWIDELYLLWGASYHLQKKLDSAYLMFQFINYAYAPQEEAGFYTYIGTRKEGAKELSIATPEQKKILHSNTFSRNNAFIWQAKTLIELGNTTPAGSLIATLKRDPAFPQRLQPALEEVEAYLYYKQGRWDSSSVHLLKAAEEMGTKAEKARWLYLAAQMMERTGKFEKASELYAKAVSMTPDPVMEVYGRLNLVRINKAGGEGAIDKNVAELLKMARRDKYEEYRDVIYYMAAQMELERNNIGAAQALLLEGAKYNNGNQASRNKALLQIADVSFSRKAYLQAASFYDSVQASGLTEAEINRIAERKNALQKTVAFTLVVQRQDSLQRIAALPKNERDDYLKKMVRRLRREQGLKEESTTPTSGSVPLSSAVAPQAGGDLFGSNRGEWYFYNNSLKAQGARQFKQVWGNRPNVDNWRRFAVVSQQLLANNVMDTRNQQDPGAVSAGLVEAELTFDALLAKLPYSVEDIQKSNDSIRNALFGLGLAFINDLEDYPSAINTLEELRRRFPNAPKMDEVLFNLYLAYVKTGNASAAAGIKKILEQQYGNSRFATITSTGKDPQAKATTPPEATKAYEGVYNLFIEGRFDEALAAKRMADSTYKTTTWQPQLLYIESVYYIKQRQDSTAKSTLQTLISQNANPVLSRKAEALLSVLNRRQQIEDELSRYQLQNTGTDTATNSASTPAIVQQPVTDTARPKPVTVALPKDTTAGKLQADAAKDAANKARIRQKEITDSIAVANLQNKRLRDSLNAVQKTNLALAKKDSLARKAIEAQLRRDSIAAAKLARDLARKDSISLAQALRKQASDSAAFNRYMSQRAKDSVARNIRDSIAKAKTARELARRDSITQRQVYLQKQRDSADAAKRNVKPIADPKSYFFDPAKPHYAVVILDKVDPVFVGEARNAFFRYNREKYYNQPLDVQNFSLTGDVKLILIGNFPTADAATVYALRAKTLAPSEIVPWLTGNKYTFTIISAANLELLKTTTDLPSYKKFLEVHLPGKF